MTNDDETILREVDQALAEDDLSSSLRKNLPAIIGAALIIVVGVGGWQVWSNQRAAASAKSSAAFNEAMRQSGTDAGTKEFETLAGEGGAYGALAKLTLAGQHSANGEPEKALALYREVYDASAASKRLKDVARLRAAYISLDNNREEVLKDVAGLETDATAIGFYAREAIALAALKAGDYQSAEEMFRKAASSPDAPEPVRLRAGELAALAGAGKAGVEFPTIEENNKSASEIYFENLEEAGSDLSTFLGDAVTAPEEDDHDHSLEPAEGAAETINPEGNE